jgi:surfeit locus 1 family protein
VSLDQPDIAAAPGSTADADAARRRWPARVGFAVLTAAAVALFVTAGNWQHDRMRVKEALRAQFDAQSAAQPTPLPDAPASGDWSAFRYRRVVASGRFDSERQIFIDNRVHAGRVGYEVVVPLVLDDGRRVLVDRGWVAQGPSRASLPRVPPPRDRVDVRGRINIPARGYLQLAGANSQGPLWQHLDPARFAEVTGVAVLPIVVEQTEPAAPGDELVRDRPAPDFGVDQHRIYMAQWYSFAALALALWIFLTLRGSRRREERPR